MAIQDFGQIAEQLRRSTVQVKAGRRGLGSGVVIKSNGVIVTNAHVAGDAGNVMVELANGTSFPARVEKRNTRRDLAVLRVSTMNLVPATLGNSDDLRVGELVMAVGNPLGFMGAVTTGIVHAVGRRPGLGPTKWIQADVQLAPGNSGGPLADARGNVVGINTMIAAGLGLAMPANTVSQLLSGELDQVFLGVVLQPTPIQIGGVEQLGLTIVKVESGSAAEYGSLRRGDILTGIEGRRFRSFDELQAALEGTGERVLHLQFIHNDPNQIRTANLRVGVSRQTAA